MANLGAILSNLGKARMPAAHLPALQPKPLMSFGAKPPAPGPAFVPHPALDPHPAMVPAQVELPSTPTGSSLPSMPQPPVEHSNPALEPRPDPTRSVYRGQLEAQRRYSDPDARRLWGIPKGQPSPAMPSAAAPVQPGIEELAAGTAVAPQLPRPAPGAPQLPHKQLFNFLTAKPGDKAYDHAAPWQNLFQELSGPVLRSPALRRGLGATGAAAAGAAGEAASSEAPQH